MSLQLIQPVRKKFSKNGGNARLSYGVSAMQGYREQMEDAHVTLEDFDAASATSFFAVYDGHGGPAVANYCAKHLHIELRANEEFHSNLATAVENTFLRMDVMLRDRSAGKELPKYDGKNGRWKKYEKKLLRRKFMCWAEKPVYEGPLDDGCTACVALIRDNHIIVGNAGDSRCIISRNGQAIDLSTDHKPDVPAETQRILHAGREINQLRGPAFRIDNGIATSRAIGDLKYKDNSGLDARDQAVTAFPEVRTEQITAGTEFLVIACDGIWDCMTSQQVVDFINIYINHDEPAAICGSLLDFCLSTPRGLDNMSVILVKFKRPAQHAVARRAQLPLPPQLPPSQVPQVQPSSSTDGGTSGANKAADDSQRSKSLDLGG